jgi:hypothetical protein
MPSTEIILRYPDQRLEHLAVKSGRHGDAAAIGRQKLVCGGRLTTKDLDLGEAVLLPRRDVRFVVRY